MVALRKNSELNLELLSDPGTTDNSFKFPFAVEETRDSTLEFELDPKFVFFEATCPLTTVRFLAAPEDELLRFFAATWETSFAHFFGEIKVLQLSKLTQISS